MHETVCDEEKIFSRKSLIKIKEISPSQTLFRLFRCTLTVSQKLAKLFGEFTKQVHLVSVTDFYLSMFKKQCRDSYPTFFHSRCITFERFDGHKKILISIIKQIFSNKGSNYLCTPL